MDRPVSGSTDGFVYTVNMSTSEPPPRFPNISVCNERVKGGQGKAGYYSLRIFGSARLAA